METGCEYLKELIEVQNIIDNMLLKLDLLEESTEQVINEIISNEREGDSD